jgi:hypothetical protein
MYTCPNKRGGGAVPCLQFSPSCSLVWCQFAGWLVRFAKGGEFPVCCLWKTGLGSYRELGSPSRWGLSWTISWYLVKSGSLFSRWLRGPAHGAIVHPNLHRIWSWRDLWRTSGQIPYLLGILIFHKANNLQCPFFVLLLRKCVKNHPPPKFLYGPSNSYFNWEI